MAMRYFHVLLSLVLVLMVIAGCFGESPVAQETRSRIEQKAETAKGLIRQRAQSGEDISGVLATMEAAGGRFDMGDVAGGETLLDQALAKLQSGESLTYEFGEPATDLYSDPQPVTVQGYDASLGIMEPFITRDGQYLLFNNGTAAHNTEGNKRDPDLHYAKRINDRTFQYRGEIRGANSNMVDGAPSLDQNNRLFFTSPRVYQEKLSTIHTGILKNGEATDVGLVSGNISPDKPGWLNMDAEISADGKTLYYTVNQWNTDFNVPKTSDLQVAHWTGGRFERRDNSDAIFHNINTGELEYAPSLSADQLELSFTRSNIKIIDGKFRGVVSRILVATRQSPREPFGEPRWIRAITGFVEGSTITPDKK
ncbi:MAG: hypothetical protein OEM27_02600, partial [Nitrospinota bacterium]|nr:hypothetical protein [Nitrospinota bacterium]